MAKTDENLAARVRTALAGAGTIQEKKMFGGLTFMGDGHICCGVRGDDLIIRVGKDRQDAAMAEPYTRPFDFTGKPLGGFMPVAPKGCENEVALKKLIGLALDFVKELPARK
jgi:TfoX/Sxy family transcriptional regulator of competence genes